MISPRSEQNKQKTAMTRLQPLQPNFAIRVEAMGANKNVPAPDPQTQIPWKWSVKKYSSENIVTCGQVESACEVLAHGDHGGGVHEAQPHAPQHAVGQQEQGEAGGVRGEEHRHRGDQGPHHAGNTASESIVVLVDNIGISKDKGIIRH